MNKPEYVFPRISIVDLTKKTNLPQLIMNLNAYHHNYFHVFNLTNVHLGDSIHQTNFKWRGSPFSISETVKILFKMDAYLRANSANTVVFCVNEQSSYLYAQVLIRQYVKICFQSSQYSFKNQSLSRQNSFKRISSRFTTEQVYFSQQLMKMYKLIKLQNPPVKILSSFQALKVDFIPIIEVYRQTRYNQLQLIYTHTIEQELTQYYLHLNKPLKKSIGGKFYDKKPQTKYMKNPVVIYGDVLIKCYSFTTLQKKLQFSLGFNTKNLIFQEQFDSQEGIICFQTSDLFQKRSETNKEIKIYIKIQNYCQNQQCFSSSNCQECLQLIKKLPHRYNQVQCELNKLHRDRNTQELKDIFSFKSFELN